MCLSLYLELATIMKIALNVTGFILKVGAWADQKFWHRLQPKKAWLRTALASQQLLK